MMDDNNKRPRSFLSFEARVAVIALLAVIVPLGIFAAISLHSSSKTLTEVVAQDLQGQAVLVARDIDNFISQRIADARLLSYANVLAGGRVSPVAQYLTDIVKTSDWLNNADIVAPSGVIIASSGDHHDQGRLLWENYRGIKGLFAAAKDAEQGQVFLSEAKMLDTGPGLLFLTPITDKTKGTAAGVLVVEVNLHRIGQIVSVFDKSVVGDKYVYIVNNAGKVIVTEDPSVAVFDSFPALKDHPGLLNVFFTPGDFGNMVYTDAGGVDVMVGYADISRFGINQALDWSIIAVAPLDEIKLPVYAARNKLFAFGLAIGLTAMLVVYAFVRKITGSLEKVAAHADTISNGDFSQRLSAEAETGGVIGSLATAFNRMASSVETVMGELQERERGLSLTLDSIGDAVIVTDAVGNITRMNPVAVTLTGRPTAEACGQPLSEVFRIVNAQTREPVTDPVDKVLQTGKIVGLANHTVLISEGGTEYQIADSAAPIRDGNGKVLGVILVFRDVTQQYQTEEALRRSQKMEAVGQLSGGVAHDFNNQLGIIIGYLDFLKNYTVDDEKAHQWVATAIRATLRCMDLTRQLLAFSRRQVRGKTVVDLNRVLRELQTMIMRSVTPEVEVRYFLADDLWPTEINPGEFHDAVLNLIINARDAMPDGGKLLIETGNKILDADYAAINPGVEPGNYVELTLSDTGVGMDRKTLERAFEPFFTTKPEGKGTGLGMAMVYGFVKRYGGYIKIYSELGVGTTVRLYLPCSTGSESPVVVDGLAGTDLYIGSESILIVDDEADLLQLADLYLRDLGYHTLLAENAAQALEILAGDTELDLLFSDVVMPGGMNGFELAQQALELRPGLQVLLTSGFTSKTMAHNGLARFAAHLLSKPYRKDELAQRIRLVLDEEPA